MFAIKNGFKQGDALLPMLLVYAFRRVQVNQEGLKLNGTHQFLVYTDNVNVQDGSVRTIKKTGKL
jgi:hypothetical protein